MSSLCVEGIWSHLFNDSSISPHVGSYLSQPAVFVVVPENAPDTYVAVRSPHSIRDASCKNGDLYSAEYFLDVVCVKKKSMSVTKINDLVQAVTKSLHRASLSAEGNFNFETVEALSQLNADTVDNFSRIVEVRVIGREVV